MYVADTLAESMTSVIFQYIFCVYLSHAIAIESEKLISIYTLLCN